MFRHLIVALILTSFLGACANSGGYGQSGSGIDKQTMGGVGGAVIGGVLGSQVGGGSGQLWATGAGTLLGALVGSSIGSSLDKADRMYADRAFSQAASSPVGQPITWANPESGNSGSYVTTRTGQTSDNRSCREFKQTIVVDGRSETGIGQACQNSDGTWKIM